MSSLNEITYIESGFPVASKLARISFVIYLFFILFGTSAPFQERILNADEISTSNPINQYGFSILYTLSFVSLIFRKNEVIQIVRNEKFLTLFLVWSFLSVFWSDFVFISFKRWTQVAGMVVVSLAVLLDLPSTEEALRYLKILLFAYIPLSVVSILFVPGAIEWDLPAWRGLAAQKNMLGQISLVSLLAWSFVLSHPDQGKKSVAIVFWLLSLVLLLGSKSTTSFLAGATILSLWAMGKLEEIILVPLIGQAFARTYFLLIGAGLVSVVLLAPDVLTYFTGTFEKDITFTGRTDLWKTILDESKKHLVMGCGYGGYWVIGSISLDAVFEEFVWLPNQSHLGYLDILNETGLIGIFLLLIMIIFYFKKASRLERPTFYIWFMIAALIINLQESTIFVMKAMTGLLFVLSYIAIFVEAMKEQRESELRDNAYTSSNV